MKRNIAFFLVMALILIFAACGGQAKTYDLAAVSQTMLDALQDKEPLTLEPDAVTDMYALDPADVKSSACIVTMGGAFPDEIIMVEAVSADAAKRVAKKLEARLADVTNQAQNYDAESLALFRKCKVETMGNYVNLFMSPDSENLRQIFTAAAK